MNTEGSASDRAEPQAASASVPDAYGAADFFASLAGCAPETAAQLCHDKLMSLRMLHGELAGRRARLPRSDKKSAGRLLAEMKSIESFLRRLRNVRGVYRADADRKETNHLWSDAVRAG